MTTKSVPKAQLSAMLALPLSIWMIVIAIITFTGMPYGDGPSWPVLTTLRDKRSSLNILNFRGEQAPDWLYKWAKGASSIAWSLLIPIQHNQYIRSSNLKLHATTGYVTILLSIELGVMGYYMSSQGMVTTHENWYHLHTFYNIPLPIPLLFWPTFNSAIAILGVFYFYSLYKLYRAIRSRKIESHRRWAVFHSMVGYAISIERFIAVLVIGLGWVLYSLPRHIQDDVLRLPRDIKGKIDVELSALAWTLTAAGLVVAAWASIEFSRAGIIRLTAKKNSIGVDKKGQ